MQGILSARTLACDRKVRTNELGSGAHFDIDRTTVHGWLKTKDQLRASVQAESTLLTKVRREGCGRKSKTADIEPALVEKIKLAYDKPPSR
jgi:hypothetical protein